MKSTNKKYKKNHKKTEERTTITSAKKNIPNKHPSLRTIIKYTPRKELIYVFSILIILALVMVGTGVVKNYTLNNNNQIKFNDNNQIDNNTPSINDSTLINNQQGETNMAKEITKVKIETTKGTIIAEIYSGLAPITAGNFLELVNQKFYNNLTFHRYVKGFVIQGGDPRGDGTGGSNKTIELEIIPELKHVKGALSMARSNKPNSASSQFYITLDDVPYLDGNYAVFGKVIEGMDIVLKLRQKDKMTQVTIIE